MHNLPVPRPARQSYVKHRQDVVRQIILPLVLVTLIVLVFATLTVVAFQGGNDISKSAAVATIWVIIPVMAVMLIVFALLVTIIWLLARLLKVTPRYTGIAQEYALWFNAQIVLWTDKIIQPILKIKAWLSLLSRKDVKEEK